MLDKTNLEQIKKVAKFLVDLDINIDKQYGFIVHHPFLKDPIVAVNDDKNPSGLRVLDINKKEDLKEMRDLYKKAINDCKDPYHIFLLLNRPYSGIFFMLIKEYLNIEDYTKILEDLWTNMEYPNADVNVKKKDWISLWKKADLNLIYSEEDKKKLASLPDEFYVYRGLMKKAKKEALSWTLDKDRAIWFAKRFDNHGKVYRGKCRKEDILVYLSCRGEEEIVVNYSKLKDVEEISYDE